MQSVNFDSLEFDRIPQRFYSSRGVPQTRWVRVGMPRIPQHMVNGVFYLYATMDDARAGKRPGGTGFIVRYAGYANQYASQHYFYGVTNWHVAVQGGFSIIRLNTKDGGTDIIELGPEDWYFEANKADVAVVPLGLDENVHDVSSISTQEFEYKPDWPPDMPYVFGVGEDVFMIGLFIDHDGVTTNLPSARFGNISMMPNEKAKIKQPNGFQGECYILDMHSRTGFSGSPVYAYRTFANDLTGDLQGHAFEEIELREFGQRLSGKLRVHNTLKLLGIHWGQFPEKWELRDKSKLQEARKDLILDGAYVEGLSGMTCVIPARQIMEIFQMDALTKLRGPIVSEPLFTYSAAPKAEAASSIVSAEANQAEPEGDSNPDHREDFTHLVDAASRKKPQAD